MSQCHKSTPSIISVATDKIHLMSTLCFWRRNNQRLSSQGHRQDIIAVCADSLSKTKCNTCENLFFQRHGRGGACQVGGEGEDVSRRRRWVQQVPGQHQEPQTSWVSLVCLHPAKGLTWLPPHTLLLKVNSRIWYATLHSWLYLDLSIRKTRFNRFWLRVAPHHRAHVLCILFE